jgi:hypothetical protein
MAHLHPPRYQLSAVAYLRIGALYSALGSVGLALTCTLLTIPMFPWPLLLVPIFICFSFWLVGAWRLTTPIDATEPSPLQIWLGHYLRWWLLLWFLLLFLPDYLRLESPLRDWFAHLAKVVFALGMYAALHRILDLMRTTPQIQLSNLGYIMLELGYRGLMVLAFVFPAVAAPNDPRHSAVVILLNLCAWSLVGAHTLLCWKLHGLYRHGLRRTHAPLTPQPESQTQL